MPLPWSFSTQVLMPWNETTAFSYVSKRNSGDVSATISLGARYQMTEQEAAKSNGVYTKYDVKITFDFAAISNGVEPKVRDTITPTEDTYPLVVISVTTNPLLQFYDLLARDLRIVYDLQDQCNILRAVPTPGGGGQRSPTYSTLAANQSCRLQPESMGVEMQTVGKILTRNRHSLYLATQTVLQAMDVIEVNSVKYEVTGQVNVSQFDTLTTATVERIT